MNRCVTYLVDTGNFFSDTDVTDSNRVAVIGPTVLQTLFAPSAECKRHAGYGDRADDSNKRK